MRDEPERWTEYFSVPREALAAVLNRLRPLMSGIKADS